jgi:hypothetical protein
VEDRCHRPGDERTLERGQRTLMPRAVAPGVNGIWKRTARARKRCTQQPDDLADEQFLRQVSCASSARLPIVWCGRYFYVDYL